MFDRLADFVVYRRKGILAVTIVTFFVAGAFGGNVAQHLDSGGFEDPGAESSKAVDTLEDVFDSGAPNILLLVTAHGGDVDDPTVAAVGTALTEELSAEPTISEAASYWTIGAPPLRNDDGDRALVVARMAGDEAAVDDAIRDLSPRYTRDGDVVEVEVGGLAEVFREVSETIEADLTRAELLAVPITLLLLLFVFGSVVAASLPLAIGALSVVGTFLVLRLLVGVTDVSIFALNLTTAMGLGLAIDYSLFVVSRYREELHAGHLPKEAVRRTIRTAGRTVAFSALTVGASLCALLVFPLYFLRSFAYAGLAVAALAGVYSVVVLPALLTVLGHRVDKGTLWKRSTRPSDQGAWHSIATFVMRRPIPVATIAIAFLLLLGAPVLRLQLGLPDDRVLQPGKSARDVHDVLRTEFSSNEAGAMPVVAVEVGDVAARIDDVTAYATTLSQLESVTRVDAAPGVFVEGQLVLPFDLPTADRYIAEGATWLNVVSNLEPLSGEGEDLVREIRDLESPLGEVQVAGMSASLTDSKQTLFRLIPVAIGIIAIVTFVLLFLMFGSVIVPVKALVLNLLSLSATFGAMVWIFQDGNFAGALDFTATGAIAASTPILMFCVAFGLSMDYEVFLLSRIKEEHDSGRTNEDSVAVGLQRTGRIVTAAAVLISVVFVAFATSNVSFIKLFGLGLALAVLMDAFVIRGTLVPAFMRMAGEVNWWAPGWMRKIHDKIGISEHIVLDDTEPLLTDGTELVDRKPNGKSNGRRRERPLVAAGRERADQP